MSDQSLSASQLTEAPNERRVRLEVVYEDESGKQLSQFGQIHIKVSPDSIYYLWNIFPQILGVGQETFSANEVPMRDDPYGYTLSRAIEHIHNYRVRERQVFYVLSWSWVAVNFDIERIKTVIDQLEDLRPIIRSYIGQPSQIEEFLWGFRVACQTFGLRYDREVWSRVAEELGLHYPEDTISKMEYDWEIVDKILEVESKAWRRTYNIEEGSGQTSPVEEPGNIFEGTKSWEIRKYI